MRSLALYAVIVSSTLLLGLGVARAETTALQSDVVVVGDLHPVLVWWGHQDLDKPVLDLALSPYDVRAVEAGADEAIPPAPGMPALHFGLSHADEVSLALKIAPNKLWAGFVYAL